jgi:pseudaminic acid biosynthesis-associated methylase
MTNQLKTWQGDFGRAYTERNVIDWRVRYPAFQQMLGGVSIGSALEVGCNRGHNLVALSQLFGEDCSLVGVEPSAYALRLAQPATPCAQLLRASIYGLPFKDRYFNLVLTSGVLIHIPLARLPSALAEIYRVSRRYILAVEYYAEEETAIHYRGYDDLLWKRDFLNHYQSQFPDLSLVGSGYWGPESGFDQAHWWLLSKAGGAEQL